MWETILQLAFKSAGDTIYQILASISLLAYPVLSGYRDALTFPVKAENGEKWHLLGSIIRGIIIVFVCPGTFILPYMVYYWIVFDGFYNFFTGRDPYYIGSTALTDRIMRFLSHGNEKVAAAIKVNLLSITLTISLLKFGGLLKLL